jgi:hypothetical protein
MNRREAKTRPVTTEWALAVIIAIGHDIFWPEIVSV